MNIFIRQPHTLWILVFGKAVTTFSYYGTLTLITLYLIHVFKFNETNSYLVYGAFISFAYSLPIIGGMIADRWLGCFNTLFIGCLCFVLGDLLLSLPYKIFFSLGLSLAVTGSGLFMSNVNHLVGNLYSINSRIKEIGFTWIYLAANIGGTLSPLIYGVLISQSNWNMGFLFSAFLVLIAFILLTYTRNSYPKEMIIAPSFRTKFFVLLGILLLITTLTLIFYTYIIINYAVIFLFIVSISYVLITSSRYQKNDQKRLLSIMLLCGFGTFYFAAGLQIGSTIPLYIQHTIDDGIIKTQLPASTFSTLYCFFVLVLAPLVSYIWRKCQEKNYVLTTVFKLVLGILLAGIGILCFAFTTLSISTIGVLTGIVLGIMLLSAGELVLTPSLLTTLSNQSPMGMKSTVMGSWSLFIALGGYLSSVLASSSYHAAKAFPIIETPYFLEFIYISVFTILIALFAFFLLPRYTLKE